jgi:hypothetical protein
MIVKDDEELLQRAQEIMERRYGTNEIKVNLRNIHYYSAYLQGARNAIKKIQEEYFGSPKSKEDMVYANAVIRKITDSLRDTQLWLEGTQIRFRNHKQNKQKKCVSVEAYFCEYRQVIREVK